jgi:N-ethylmaleimide reductase
LESLPEAGEQSETNNYLTPILREIYQGNFLINGGYNKESANEALINNKAEAVAFGTAFISNPDLVERFSLNVELAEPDSSTFYTAGAEGYTDYPNLA